MEQPTELNDREQTILQAVVHTYITTAEPVGSRAVVKRYSLRLSPATVRNAMADLEEAGFLQQVHASSGRVPTNRGYRYYIDYLMQAQRLTLAERGRIQRRLSACLTDAEEVMRQTSQLLALISRHMGIVEAPSEDEALVRTIELMPLTPNRLAILVADNYGRVRNEVVALDETLDDVELTKLRRFLNETLRGVVVSQARAKVQSSVAAFQDERRRLAEWAWRIFGPFPVNRPAHLYLDGAAQLFEQPEFQDVEKAREVFNLIEEQDRLLVLLRAGMRGGPRRTHVLIGAETERQGLEEISVVASPYCVGDKAVGMIGVLGPKRMPYPRLTGIVDYMAAILSRYLTQLAG